MTNRKLFRIQLLAATGDLAGAAREVRQVVDTGLSLDAEKKVAYASMASRAGDAVLARTLLNGLTVDGLAAEWLVSLLQSMAHAFSMNHADLASRNVPKGGLRVLLAPRLRHAYCPLCFEGDWLSGTTPYFRLDWGRLWMTHCRAHGAPLYEWMALNGYGGRRLPHAYFLPYDASALLSGWLAANLREARAWQSSTLRSSEAYDLWRALIRVEEGWSSAGIGDPWGAPEGIAAGESVLAGLAPLFLAARGRGQLCLAEALHVPPHEHLVFGYDRRRQGREINGTFNRLRWRLPSIQARRIVLILVAHTLGILDVDLRFETGARLPTGRSHDWASRILDHQNDYRRAQHNLYAAERWLLRTSLGM